MGSVIIILTFQSIAIRAQLFVLCVTEKQFSSPFLKFKSFLYLIAIPIVTVLGIVYSDYTPLFIYAISLPFPRRTLRKILIFLKFHCQINISMHGRKGCCSNMFVKSKTSPFLMVVVQCRNCHCRSISCIFHFN